MKRKSSMKKIVFCTFSNFRSGAFGDAINDRKLFDAIPPIYKKIALFPKFNKNNKISLKSVITFYGYYIKEIITTNNVFIIRGPKLAILPILLRKFFKNRIILRSGCTPLMFVERKAFLRNIEYKPNESFLLNFFYYIEPNLEIYALRHVDDFIVENTRAKKILIYYGASSNKIKIIPYYIQEYFLKGNNPDFNRSKDCFKVGYVGRFKKYDLIIPIINAIKYLKENNYNVKLYLIGDGPKRKNIENLVENKDLREDATFLGAKPHKQLSNLINEYHCLLFPMFNNLCPSTIAIKILENVMKGKIIITSNSGNNVSLFRENRDLILDLTSYTSIAQKIKLVIDNYDKYKKIAENLSEYHSKFRSKSINTKLLAELLNKSF
ncbi:MAG: glycosyltransferase family 4 protein [Promethearchaeota archaeon]